MMDLTFAIQHCEEVAESREKMAQEIHDGILWHEDFEEDDCRKCAEDHRQLASWLKELEVYRDGGPKGKWIEQERGKFVCNQCGYTVYAEDADDFHFCTWCGAKMMEVEADAKKIGCAYCKHKYREQHERPCSLCQRNFVDKFEREADADDA